MKFNTRTRDDVFMYKNSVYSDKYMGKQTLYLFEFNKYGATISCRFDYIK